VHRVYWRNVRHLIIWHKQPVGANPKQSKKLKSTQSKLLDSMSKICLLSPSVMTEIDRLGGKWEPPSTEEPRQINGHQIPEAIWQFLYEIRWPQRTYCSSEQSSLSVWDMSFFCCGWLEDVTIKNRNDRSLVYFGMADGGNNYLILDIDDANPSDPDVYKVDHDDPDQSLYDWLTLSGFLRELIVEG
jgi:hypothetical protein